MSNIKREIVPTVVPASLEDVKKTREDYRSFATAIHVDAADGVFAANTTWMPGHGDMLPDANEIFYEAHMMVANPLAVGVAFARAGAMRIIGHLEAFQNAEKARETFMMWKQAGAKEVGIGILMTTSLDALAPYVSLCSSVTLMTIASIGVQGIPFDEKSIARVEEAHKRYPTLTLSVDGGVSPSNIKKLAHAGASRFSVGSAISKSDDAEKTYNTLLKLAQ